jgi:RNA polymerase sigma-70 factor (ECF subfamily)
LRHTLTPDQRETLELHLFEGYSLREIAERNDQTLGNVRNHYYRALDRLRAHIFPRKGR